MGKPPRLSHITLRDVTRSPACFSRGVWPHRHYPQLLKIRITGTGCLHGQSLPNHPAHTVGQIPALVLVTLKDYPRLPDVSGNTHAIVIGRKL